MYFFHSNIELPKREVRVSGEVSYHTYIWNKKLPGSNIYIVLFVILLHEGL